jgi:hypothetical protein
MCHLSFVDALSNGHYFISVNYKAGVPNKLHLYWGEFCYLLLVLENWNQFFCPIGSTAPSGPGPPHYRGFMITLRHTTLGRTPLDEWSAQRRDLYPTIYNTHKRQTSMPMARFEPAIPASERLQTLCLRPRGYWVRRNPFKWRNVNVFEDYATKRNQWSGPC